MKRIGLFGFGFIGRALYRAIAMQAHPGLCIAFVWNRSPGLGITQDWFSTAQYFDIKNGHSGFEDVAIAFGTKPVPPTRPSVGLE